MSDSTTNTAEKLIFQRFPKRVVLVEVEVLNAGCICHTRSMRIEDEFASLRRLQGILQQDNRETVSLLVTGLGGAMQRNEDWLKSLQELQANAFGMSKGWPLRMSTHGSCASPPEFPQRLQPDSGPVATDCL